MELSKEDYKALYDDYRGEKEALDKNEMETLVQKMGFNPTTENIEKFMEDDGKISLEEFCKFMESLPKDPNEDLRAACKHYDKNNDGHMDAKELKEMLGDGDDVVELLSRLGIDSDSGKNSVEIEEFISIINENSKETK